MTIKQIMKDDPTENIDFKILRVLKECNIYVSYLGYRYLKKAITKVIYNPTKIQGIIKNIYDEIASEDGVKSTSVERGIRHAIERAWSIQAEVPSDIIENTFKYSKRVGKYKPSNSEFISAIAEEIRLHRNINKYL